MFRWRNVGSLTSIETVSQQVFQEIDKHRINKLPGVNEAFPRVLRECKNTFSVALMDL